MPDKEKVKVPELTRTQIREKRHELHAKRTRQLAELSKKKYEKIDQIAKEYYVNLDMVRSPQQLAIEIEKYEKAIKEGNKDAIKLRENVIRAKYKIEDEIKKFDEKRKKIIEKFRKEEDALNKMDAYWREKNIEKRYRDMELRRATGEEVDALSKEFYALKKEVEKYRLDRHLVAQMENLKVENQVIKQQIQKILQILAKEGIGK